jgi:hypothetical protein
MSFLSGTMPICASAPNKASMSDDGSRANKNQIIGSRERIQGKYHLRKLLPMFVHGGKFVKGVYDDIHCKSVHPHSEHPPIRNTQISEYQPNENKYN